MNTNHGTPHLFGICENLPPILNLPANCKVKVRMRNNAYIAVFVKSEGAIEEYRLRGNDDFCYLSLKQGGNLKL